MAWQNYGWVWNVVGVQGSEYVLLMYLANEADGEGLTPLLKIEKIMRYTNLSRRSVFEHLKTLEAKGFVERKRKWAKAPFEANAFQLDLSRYYPLGEYNDAKQLWAEILDTIPRDEMKAEHRYILARVSDVFLQKNAKVLHLVTDIDVYEDTILENLSALKKAGKLLTAPVRRFEIFRPDFRQRKKKAARL